VQSAECRFVAYEGARQLIHHGDLLLYRGGRWPVDLAIRTAGRSPYVHAAMAAWEDGRVYCLEMVECRGGRRVLLAEKVLGRPGRWDVFRTNPDGWWPEFDAAAAVEAMTGFIGTRYGWINLLRTGLLHLPLLRLLVRAETDDQARTTRPPYCSQAIAIASRVGGLDPVPNLADRLTEPGDLARSLFFRYQFTLL